MGKNEKQRLFDDRRCFLWDDFLHAPAVPAYTDRTENAKEVSSIYPDRNTNRPPQALDQGPNPLIVNIDLLTKVNPNYRTALWTGNHLQVTLMSIPVGGDIGLEVHPDVDQFIRIEEGEALAVLGPQRDNLNDQRRIDNSFAVIVPAGTWHNIINTGRTPLKLYSIYAPPNHPFGTIHRTKEEAEKAEG